MNMLVQIEIDSVGGMRIGSNIKDLAPTALHNILLEAAKLTVTQMISPQPKSSIVLPTMVPPSL